MSNSQVSPEDLQQFIPFQGLDQHQLLLLASRVGLRQLERGTQLFAVGDIDSNEFFLLHGRLRLESADGKSLEISAGDDAARRQIARLRPRQYTVSTLARSTVIVIDADILEEIQQELGQPHGEEETYFVDEVSSVEEAESQELFSDFQSALQQNKFVLPSLPEVALRVRELLQHGQAHADVIAHVVNSDPAIAAKLIRAANSPLYHGAVQCETTRNAIVRLGLATTQQLVVSFALRDLFDTSSSKLKKRMQQAWQHSVEVAAISFVIARMLESFELPAEEVLLAGLLHDIGIIAILGYLEAHPLLLQDDSRCETVIQTWRGRTGEQILSRWKFPPVFIKVALQADNWQRGHAGSADICDVVQVAKLHSYIRNRQPMPLARIDQLPAFHKLPLGELTPELTIRILEQAKDQINEAKQLLLGS